MGVDTKILLTSNPSPLDVLVWVDKHYERVNITASSLEDFYYINFKDGEDERHVSFFTNGNCSSDYQDISSSPCAYLSMGCWGNSEVIARRMAIYFGGFIMVNDCSGDWIKP